MTRTPRIVLTPGEPAGIGPDLCALIHAGPLTVAPVVIADPDLLRQRAARLGLSLQLDIYSPDKAHETHRPGHLTVLPVPLARAARAGELDKANAAYVLATLDRAVQGCLRGEFDALVTGPVHKGIINEAGIPFTGHTEYLAERTGGHPVMMLAAPGLRVALATTHLPLSAVPAAITRASLETVLLTLDRDLRRRFGIRKPHILVCGLNPHAGEGGHMGTEEQATIIPVLNHLREQGMNLSGPLPADTLFTPRQLAGADAVLAMYHDQGLPVLKHLGFGRAVNITLGLPIIRTSVDHGTALDLAGTGQAETGSLLAALEAAAAMASTTQ